MGFTHKDKRCTMRDSLPVRLRTDRSDWVSSESYIRGCQCEWSNSLKDLTDTIQGTHSCMHVGCGKINRRKPAKEVSTLAPFPIIVFERKLTLYCNRIPPIQKNILTHAGAMNLIFK